MHAQLLAAVRGGSKEELQQTLNGMIKHIPRLLNSPDTPHLYLHEACQLGWEEVVTLLTGYVQDLNHISAQVTLHVHVYRYNIPTHQFELTLS